MTLINKKNKQKNILNLQFALQKNTSKFINFKNANEKMKQYFYNKILIIIITIINSKYYSQPKCIKKYPPINYSPTYQQLQNYLIQYHNQKTNLNQIQPFIF
ncbi:hypothetical protein ABPG74_002204 [Tetrahymena malaccensis]